MISSIATRLNPKMLVKLDVADSPSLTICCVKPPDVDVEASRGKRNGPDGHDGHNGHQSRCQRRRVDKVRLRVARRRARGDQAQVGARGDFCGHGDEVVGMAVLAVRGPEATDL